MASEIKRKLAKEWRQEYQVFPCVCLPAQQEEPNAADYEPGRETVYYSTGD